MALPAAVYVECCVQFVCQEGHGDFVSSVDERETCSYVVSVHTSRICTHPLFASPISVKSLPISCSPLLSASDYEMYMKGKCLVVYVPEMTYTSVLNGALHCVPQKTLTFLFFK